MQQRCAYSPHEPDRSSFGALESLNEEAVPLGLLGVSWIKTKVQAFGDILDATVESISMSGENVEVTQPRRSNH